MFHITHCDVEPCAVKQRAAHHHKDILNTAHIVYIAYNTWQSFVPQEVNVFLISKPLVWAHLNANNEIKLTQLATFNTNLSRRACGIDDFIVLLNSL